MSLHKNIGDEAYNVETGDGEAEVSYVPEEGEAKTSEEKSDAQLIADGEMGVDEGDSEIFVDPNASYGKKTEEKTETDEEEVKEEEKKEEKPPEGEKKPDEKPSEEEEKKKTGEPAPEVVKLAKRYSQKRINKISREKFQLRDENEKLRKELQELKGKSREVDLIKKRAEHSTTKPKAEDFASDAEFYEALGRWSAKDEIYEHEASQPVEKEPTDEDKQVQTFENVRDKILSDGEDKYEDFSELVLKTDGSIVITPEMILAVGDSDNAADVFYYLGQNPEESHRIARLNSAQIAREMGKIESKFLVEEVKVHTPEQDSELLEDAKKKAEPKPKPASPPAPVKPLGGGGKSQKNLDEMSIEEYFEARGFDRTGMKKRVNK